MKTTLTRLSRKQVIAYHISGFITVDKVLGHSELQQVIDIYDGLFSGKAGWDAGDHFDLGGTDIEGSEAKLPQILDVSRYAPEIKSLNFYRNCTEIARQLLGEDCVIKGEHAINKLPDRNNPTPWHQDEAYWQPDTLYESLSIWIPLQDVSVANGCMQFLPRSHNLGVLEHRSIGGDARVHGLEAVTADLCLDGALACPLPAGSATVHGNRMLHYAGPNQTSSPRRALIFMAELPHCPYPAKRQFPWNEIKETARNRRALQS